MGASSVLSADVSADAAARAARVELDRLLEADAPALRASLPTGFADAAERYVALLLEANARLNLTRIVEPAAIARLHLLDSLAALPIMDASAPARALDLGSGGGVPGLVLALARPDVAWTLVDSVGKKVDALRRFADGARSPTWWSPSPNAPRRSAAIRRLASVVRRRHRAGLRATSGAGRVRPPAPPCRRHADRVEGPIPDDELRAGEAAAAALGGSAPEVRPTGVAALGDHRFVVVRKVGRTPDRYPRRPGEPSRRPLG